jgi:hypothetical protein
MKRASLNFGLPLFLLFLSFVAVAKGSDVASPSYIYGRWVVRRLLPTNGISAGPRELNAVIGAVAVYSASRVQVRFPATQNARLENFVVEHPKYRFHLASADEFFRDTYLSPRDIGILREYVEIIEIRNADGSDVIKPATLLYVRDKNHLVTIWDGGFFEMVRQK